MERAPTHGAMPRSARTYLATTLVAALATLGASLVALPRGLEGPDLTFYMGALALAASAMFFLQTRSMTLPWSGERIAIHPDEAVLLVVLYFVPGAGSVVVVAAGATLMAQALLRKPPTKAAFNVAVVTLAGGAAALAFAGARAMGLSPAASVAVVPFVFGAVNQALVALMLTLVSGRPVRAALRPQLGRSIFVAGSAGLIMGGLTIVFLEVHWLLLAAVVAVGFVFYKAMESEYRHESELAARRALNGAMSRLSGRHDEEDIIMAVHDACREAFTLRGFEVTLQHPERAPKTWVLSSGPISNEPISLVRAPLVTPTGANVGQMVLTVGARGRKRLKEDEELASVFAGYLAAALGQAEALRLLAEERELASRNERLASIGTLVAGVAHEINNPLMYMQGHLELAIADARRLDSGGDVDTAELVRGLETALKGARRIEFISKGLRVVARQEPARSERVSLNDLARRVVARASMRPHVRVSLDLDPRDPTVQGDPVELEQVASNLLTNAIEATPATGGTVILQTLVRGELAEMAVRDEGAGIAPGDRGKLFTPFFTTKVDGTGLGLPMVHSLVRAHRGEVLVESEPGRGACFRVRLPGAAQTAPRA